MMIFKRAARLVYINYVLAKYGLDQLLATIKFFSVFRIISYVNPWNWFRPKSYNRGLALRLALEDLGPIFIKLGQALSTRPDIVPADIMVELRKLQDSVPPFPSEKVLSILEKTYGKSVFEIFKEFDPIALASASIAQVHAAQLQTGEDVVVKILRPNVQELIDRDIGILKIMARLIDKHLLISKRLKPMQIIAEFEGYLNEELDLQREAANSAQVKRNFQGSRILYIPKIYWDYVQKNVMVAERIYGTPIANIQELKERGTNLRLLAERGLEIFFTQVFRHGFFHADMHPGNIFVSLDHPDNPNYICVDFGIVGRLCEQDKRYLVENLHAFFNRDYLKIAQIHVESGWVPSHTRIDDFEAAIRTVCEPIFEKPLKDISCAQLILQLFLVGRSFEMEIQPQLILLQKTLFASEGLARQIYPDLNFWDVGKPFVERWLREQIGPRALIRNLRETIPFVVEDLPFMPKLLNDVLHQLKQQNNAMTSPKHAHQSHRSSNRRQARGQRLGFLTAMLLMAVLGYQSGLNTEELSMVALVGALVSGGLILLG